MQQGMNQMWLERDVPFLQAVNQAEEKSEHCDLVYIAAYTGLDLPTVQSAARNLQEDQLIDGAALEMLDIGLTMSNIRLTASGRKALKQWHSEV